jgi:hypothetical protein
MLTPKNWSSFQHYKDRAPSWIKLHKSLLNDFAFARLPLASKALAPLLWVLASEYENGSIRASLDEIAFRIHVTRAELDAGLKPLIEAGFFITDDEVEQVASNALAEPEQGASDLAQPATLEKEKRREEKETDSRSVAKATRPNASRFEEFWQAYPRRDGPNPRKDAEQRFNSLVKSGVDPQMMIDAVRELCEAERKRGNIGTRFIPQAKTWLNQQRWSDHAAVAMVQALAAAENLSKKVHVKADTPQWRAWTAHLGREMPQDRNFGWLFDSEWPPGYAQTPKEPSTHHEGRA